jgi:hypothetical protein
VPDSKRSSRQAYEKAFTKETLNFARKSLIELDEIISLFE